jgi:hypothetical protein
MEEVVTFSKRKPEEEQGEAPPTRPEKKEKERKLRSNNLVMVTDKRPPKTNAGPPRDHSEKMLEAPCPYDEGPAKHAMKDCNLTKRYLSG